LEPPGCLRRTKHGALLDAELLAEVYLELIGARQAMLGLADASAARIEQPGGTILSRARPQPLASRLSEAERTAHAAFVATLGGRDAAPIWRKYRPADGA
jgi:DNA polymerase III subunit epsilon